MEFTYCDNTFSDFFKDVNGFRPRGSLMEEWEGRTPRQKQELWNALGDELEENTKREAKFAEEQVEQFKADVEAYITLGARDRADALRWMTQSYTFWSGQCVEGWVWEKGFLFTDYGKALVQELLQIVKYQEAT